MNYMEFRPEEAQRVLREMERNHQVDYSGRRVYQRRIYQIVDALTFALTPTEEIKRDRKERAENKAKRERKARIQEARYTRGGDGTRNPDNRMMMGIWQCEAYNKTMLDAIKAFAETYWDKPRRARKPDEHGYFKIMGGRNTYRCELVNGVPGVSPEVWRIKGIA